MFFCSPCSEGEAFHPADHHQQSDLSVPPNSPTGLSSQHSSLLPPKQTPGVGSSGGGQHIHAGSTSSGLAPSHAPFSPLTPGSLHAPPSKHPPAGSEGPNTLHKAGTCKNSHIPSVNAQHLNQHGRLVAPIMTCNHPCNGHNGSVTTANTGHVTPGACK